MGVKSTAVKCVMDFEVDHEDGGTTRVLEVHWVDPSDPTVLLIDKSIWPRVPLEYISLTITV